MRDHERLTNTADRDRRLARGLTDHRGASPVPTATALDGRELQRAVDGVYRTVAATPTEVTHFETGRELASRLGYPPADLERVPETVLRSFTGVGYHHDLAGLGAGDAVLDLGSGSGTDAFVAALRVGDRGRALGVERVEAQLTRARRLREDAGVTNATFQRGTIEALPLADGAVDVVLSNGTLVLAAHPERVLAEASRVLASGGRLAISELVCERRLPAQLRRDPELRAIGIGGAMELATVPDVLASAGFRNVRIRENPWYEFVSTRARSVCQQYGVGSVSLRAELA
ncbi:methyltransferase domain-containing protein [Natronococcus occultus]|uniref:Arsenite methyltransferase n=1 Tax=Natronococcus occultus SP4 TaxID=694430 RepID=L0K256_9EURY|nr:methyltransferase domain-containing protein [Natronococcus occultus]AGB39372.1 methylase involved in ubiquinone/menaquinone biosynthesis [Natronococcus occultus SP4]